MVVLQKAMQSTPRDFTKNANELSLVTVLAPGNAWKNFVVNQIWRPFWLDTKEERIQLSASVFAHYGTAKGYFRACQTCLLQAPSPDCRRSIQSSSQQALSGFHLKGFAMVADQWPEVMWDTWSRVSWSGPRRLENIAPFAFRERSIVGPFQHIYNARQLRPLVTGGETPHGGVENSVIMYIDLQTL